MVKEMHFVLIPGVVSGLIMEMVINGLQAQIGVVTQDHASMHMM